MFENFKTDIVYYNTPTDFEMEFNIENKDAEIIQLGLLVYDL